MIELAIAIIGLIILAPILLFIGISKEGSYEIYNGGSDKIDYDYLKIMIKRIEGKTFQPIYEYDQLKSVKYPGQDAILKMGCHNGQRKLLLTEIEFFSKSPNFIIYIGSAPNEHMPILLEMFPTYKFLLIDPNYHTFDSDYKYVYMNVDVISQRTLKNVKRDLDGRDTRRYNNAKRLLNVKFLNGSTHNVVDNKKDDMDNIKKNVDYKTIISSLLDGNDRIYIIQDYMTPELARHLTLSLKHAKNPEFGFVSDIRTNMFNPAGPVDIDYVWNDGLQLIFLKTMKPTVSMLKFHPPLRYSDDNSVKDFVEGKLQNDIISADLEYIKKEYKLDMIKGYQIDKHMYLSNTTIYLQAWAPKSSTESRLIITSEDIDKPLINYDYNEWLNKYAYLKYIRGYAYFDHYKYFSHLPLANVSRLDGCFDCMLETIILSDYLMESSNIKLNIPKIMKWLSNKQNATNVSKLWQKINNKSLYPVDQKGIHGYIRSPTKNIHYYEYNENGEIFEIDNKMNKSKVYDYIDGKLIPVNGYKLNIMDSYTEKDRDLEKLAFNVKRSIDNW